MSESNQVVLSFSHIVFDQVSFKRLGFRQPDDQGVSVNMSYSIRRGDVNQYCVTLNLQATKKNEYEMSVQITGYCEIDDNHPGKDVILRENAAAILYPYVRSEVSLLTAQPETTPLVLPVANIHEMMKQDNSNH